MSLKVLALSKMGLGHLVKDMLRPVGAVDKEILRWYTKKTRDYESNGKSRYPLCMTLTFGSLFLVDNGTRIPEGSSVYLGTIKSTKLLSLGAFTAAELSRSFQEWINGRKVEDEVRVRETIGMGHLDELVSPYTRFPIMATAGVFAAKGAVELYHWYQGETNGMNTYKSFEAAIGLFCMSSSMYIKDADKDTLKKDPLWKQTYDGVVNRIKQTIIPEHTPIPTPCLAYENYSGGTA
jgi:hypothetical protein